MLKLLNVAEYKHICLRVHNSGRATGCRFHTEFQNARNKNVSVPSHKLLAPVAIMLPCEFSLPFFSAITETRCVFRKSTKADVQKRISLLPLSHACLFCGGESKQVNSHGSDFQKLELAIHLFSFAAEARGEDLQRSTEG